MSVEPKYDSDPMQPQRREPHDPIADLLVKAQLVVGVALAGVAGPLFAHAIMTGYTASWWIGGTCLATGVVLILAGLTGSKRRAQELLSRQEARLTAQRSPHAERGHRDPTMPMLGALLVYKYGVITETQLQRALSEQRKLGEPRPRLGEVLLDLGLVTDLQLRKALAYQRSRAKQVAVASRSDTD
ncbi:MAG: hypothetical protein JXA57_06875 [Armatimonadetes bacterium]|nr:hypothetical protein [Armatimonadota bacterium]